MAWIEQGMYRWRYHCTIIRAIGQLWITYLEPVRHSYEVVRGAHRDSSIQFHISVLVPCQTQPLRVRID